MTPSAGPCTGQQRDEARRARRSACARRGSRDAGSRRGTRRSHARVALGAEQQDEPSRWSSRPPALPTTTIRAGSSAIAASSASSRSVASLAAGWRSIAGAGGLDRGEPRRRDRVEVADRDVDVSPSASARSTPPSAAITTPLRQGGRAAGGRDALRQRRRWSPLHAHTSAGITQIRFAGRRRVSRPLSPVCPSSPYRCADPSSASMRASLSSSSGCPAVAALIDARPRMRS